ncbi:MAG: radical SAM-associated putative lipoprotein [Bacteroidales bacterium]|nr:radical SAM-associated putative lipoprotein [Bacteroidales bacterium]
MNDKTETMFKRIRNPRRFGFISMLLSLLGLGASGCITPCMYGTPNAGWTVKGKVVNENGAGISGIQVVINNHFQNSPGVIYDQNDWPLDTLVTKSDGSYELQQNGFPIQQLKVDVHDVDGEAGGGEFSDVTLIIKDIDYSEGDGWYEGHAEIEVPDIMMHRKN